MVLPELAIAQQSGDPAEGQRLAMRSCISCHGSQSSAHRASSFSDIAAMKSTTGKSLNVFLRTSHPSMPNLILTPKDRDDVIAYILSLR
jgi:cytochrome c